MLAIKINAVNQTIEPVHVHSLEDLQAVVGGYIETGLVLESGDYVFVNEEGLINPCDHFFFMNDAIQPFAGNGVVVGPADSEGENTDVVFNVDDIAKRCQFLTRAQVVQWLNQSRPYDRSGGFSRMH